MGGSYSQNFQTDEDGNVYVTESLDRDYPGGTANWQINVAASDENGLPGGNSKTGYGILNYLLDDINDNAPFFDVSTLVGYVPEDSEDGDTFMTVVAFDYDEGENAEVSYTAQNIPSDDQGELFSMNSAGVVQTTSNRLNREEQDMYYMHVTATDAGENPLSSECFCEFVCE